MSITFEKLLSGIRASLGGFHAGGKTKKEAQENLLSKISTTPSDSMPEVCVGSDGAVWVLWWNITSWGYTRYADNRPTSSCFFAEGWSREKAVDILRKDMEQYYQK